MKFLFVFGFLILNVLFLPSAEARFGREGFLIDVSLYNTSTSMQQTTTSGTGEIKSSTMIYDINAGKVSDKGYYYGGIYTSRSTTSNGVAGEGGSAMGFSVGLFSESGYFVMAHYLLTATDTSLKAGSGYQLDGGFKFSIGNSWLLGGNFTYRSITYTKLKIDDPTFVSQNVTELMPMLSLGYLF